MSEEQLPQYLTELICTRISHDIIGNVGAVANAVELLEEGDVDFLDNIRSILKVSSKVLTARLKFFRLAFGLPNSNLEDLETIEKTAASYLTTLGNASYPISLSLNLQTPKFTRHILISIMILADVIVRGGNIEVKELNDGFEATVRSQYPLAAEKISNIKSILQGDVFDCQAQYGPVVYLQNMLNNSKKINIIEDNIFGFIIR